MDVTLNLSEATRQDAKLGEPDGGYSLDWMADEKSAQEVRRRFVGWLRWYMAEEPGRVPNDAALADKLGISGAAVSYLMRRDSKRLPRLETVLAACKLTGLPADVLLFREPPTPRTH